MVTVRVSAVSALWCAMLMGGCATFRGRGLADPTGVDIVPPSFVGRGPSGAGVHAHDREGHESPEARDRENERRMAFLQRAIDEDAIVGSRWRWGWVIVFSGLVTGNVVRAIAFEGGGRDAGIVGALGSSIGLASVLLQPPRVLRAPEDVRRIRSRPGRPSDLDVEHAEEILRQCAQSEAAFSAPIMQVGRSAVAVLLGVILGVGFQRPDAAAFNFGAGVVIGQILRITHPTGSREALRAYEMALEDGAFRTGASPSTALRLPPRGPTLQWGPAIGSRDAPFAIGGTF